MRNLLLGLCLLLPTFSLAQGDIKYKEYSYTEFFRMIEAEEDTIFRLENALIKYDSLTDERFLLNEESEEDERGNYYINASRTLTDSLFINIPLALNNVQFQSFTGNYDIDVTKGLWDSDIAGFYLVSFEEEVTFTDTSIIPIWNCSFKKQATFRSTDKLQQIASYLDTATQFELDLEGGLSFILTEDGIQINNSLFKDYLSISLTILYDENERSPQMVSLSNIDVRKRLSVRLSYMESFLLRQSSFNKRDDGIYTDIMLGFITDWSITDNNSDSGLNLEVRTGNENKAGKILGNSFKAAVRASFINDYGRSQNESILKSHWQIDWGQWYNKVITENGRWDYIEAQRTAYREENGLDIPFNDPKIREISRKAINVEEYKKTIATSLPLAYLAERKMRVAFLKHYRELMDQVNVNLVYLELKDLETLQLAGQYHQNPNFENFFTWKINQFLKVFSAYGTRPAKAIVFSMYVIIAFAFIYLFFPNHWDSHGKNRIIDRFSFFLKYMKQDAGMHDVYLEEKQGDILAYNDYKQLIESSGKEVPKFFQATALPMYKWAISGTKMTAAFLSRVDVMKGTWSELPASKRVWKSILLTSAFLIALTYDIFIKMLNALMLSINTFTTLGFGEIPIKGLPRYLAIIQGFIGWFMLTIFSVSLISQLLN